MTAEASSEQLLGKARNHKIQEEKERLQEEYTFLEKAKIIKEKLFDPEYYDKNKDRQIRVLTKELFTKDRGLKN